MSRGIAELGQLRLPASAIPRPGENVIWYQGKARYQGTYMGHRADGAPWVKNEFGSDSFVPSFGALRLKDPFDRVQPNWMRLPTKAVVCYPTDKESARFNDLLAQHTPPGPSYAELVQELWARGHETFVVGGTVRDVLTGHPSSDVDLVTTMPLTQALPLIREMYGWPRKLDEAALKNGHIRVGGKPGSTDPFIDITVFKHSFVGQTAAMFSDSFKFDTGNRDFACNSVYYDPVGKVLFDPSGHGISDAENRLLTLVADPQLRTKFQLAQIAIRFVKFRCRGFNGSAECATTIAQQYLPLIQTMPATLRGRYIRTQILSKAPPEQHEARFEQFRVEFIALGVQDLWIELIEPIRDEIFT